MENEKTQTKIDRTPTPVELLVEEYGSKAAIGRLIGKERGTVSAWGDFVPSNHAITIERISNGKFKAVDLVGETA